MTYKEIREIYETRTLKVASRGGALYLYLPRSLEDIYRILAGDMIKVKLMEIFRPKRPGESEKDIEA